MLLGEELTGGVIGAFYDVYNALRFGFLEAVYANALECELRARGLAVAREATVDVHYKGEKVGVYRVDMLVQDVLVVEVKATRFLDSHAEQQVLNYLRATRLEIGLLLHFGVRPAFKRFVSSNRPGPYIRDAIAPR